MVTQTNSARTLIVLPRNRELLHSGGFTLIEIMVTIAILAILVSLAVPSFSDSIRRGTIENYLDRFASAVRLARAESMARNQLVVICPTDPTGQGITFSTTGTPVSPSNVCVDTTGINPNAWADGWVVFVDDGAGTPANAGNGSWDAGEEILNHHFSSDASSYKFYIAEIDSAGTSAPRYSLVFDPRGRSNSLNSGVLSAGSFWGVSCHADDAGDSGRNVMGFTLEKSGRFAMAPHSNTDGSAIRKNINGISGANAASSTLTCTNV